MSADRRRHVPHRRRSTRRGPHQDEAGLLQVADQVVGGDAGHQAVGMVDVALAVVAERVGDGVGELGELGGSAGRSGGAGNISRDKRTLGTKQEPCTATIPPAGCIDLKLAK